MKRTEVASVSTQFTAARILVLVDEGALIAISYFMQILVTGLFLAS